MRTFSLLLLLATALIGAFVGCQADSRGPDGPVIRDEQWPALLAQRENQPATVWRGSGTGTIEATSLGWGGGGLEFRDSASHLAEDAGRKALARNPRLFVPLLASEDPQVVFAAICIYRCPKWQEQMRFEDRAAVAQGFRALLDHKDVRMRCTAVQVLGKNRMLTAEDAAKGLGDASVDVRVNTASCVSAVQETPVVYADSGRVLTRQESIQASREIDRKLIPVLLAHLDDSDFRVRDACARNAHMAPCNFAVRPPAWCDFVRAGWAEYTQARKDWQAWWQQHGEESLVAAYPDVPPVKAVQSEAH